jgi:hypothetical protein
MSRLHHFPEPGYIMFFYLSQQRFYEGNAGNVQQNACGVRLYGRKFPLSAIFC